VLVAELAEQLRERELDALCLVLVPRGRAEVVAADCGRHRLHLLDADDERAVIAAGVDLRARGEQRDRARRTRRFVATGGQTGECGMYIDEQRAEMALHRVQLGGEVADVTD